MPHTVQLTDATFARLQRLATVPLVDTVESVIVGLLDRDQGRAVVKPNGHGMPTPVEDIEDADQLPQKAFRVPLLEAMYELGGVARPNQATELVGRKVAPLLGSGDHKLRPDGKERWENIVHWNRNELKNEGFFKNDSERNVWELSDEGIKYAETLIASRKHDNDQNTKPQTFNAKSVPNLRHTKLLSAKVASETIRPTWNELLFHLIRLIPKDRLAKTDEGRRLIIVNFVPGKKEDEGYRFVPEHGISVQGQGANDAWKGASHIAQRLGVPVEVEFLWRMKDGAAHPGVTGRLSI
jgi:hypothetical protein